jgi:hypothetical protein
MRNSSHRIVLPAVCALCLVVAGASAASKTATTAHKGVVPTFTPAAIPQSVYVVPSTPKDGRNPFFPQSVATPAVVKPKEGAAVDMAAFVLNGITSPPRRTAMINGRTFEPGEEGEVKLPNGAKVLIKCEEIGSDSTIIQVNGVRRELRLRFGL